MNDKASRTAHRTSRRRPIFIRRPRPEVRGQAAAGYRDPFFTDAAVVEDDARRLRGPDD